MPWKSRASASACVLHKLWHDACVCGCFLVFFFTHNYIVPGCQTLIHISGAKANSCLEGDLSRFKEATERDAESC